MKSWALVPLMRWWSTSAIRSHGHVPRPKGAPQAHARGHDPDRVLLMGAGLAVGWGVASHDLALPGCLARALSAHTGRGTDVDLVAEADMSVRQARGALEAVNLTRYDAVILVLGVPDAVKLTPLPTWRHELSELLSEISSSALPDTNIVVTSIQPIRAIPVFDSFLGTLAERHAAAMNRETAMLCDSSPRATFVTLSSPPLEPWQGLGHHTAEYEYWGEVLASALAPMLGAEHRPEDPRQGRYGPRVSASELSRLKALDEIQLSDRRSRGLEQILGLAQRAFDAEMATITVLDADSRRCLAQVGSGDEEALRDSAFIDVAISGRGATIVRDARDDARFRDQSVVDGSQVRFYAGFPIELPSGELIGVLSVVDSHPRRRDGDIDDVLFRELALMAQRELGQHIADLTEPDSLGSQPTFVSASAAPRLTTTAGK